MCLMSRCQAAHSVVEIDRRCTSVSIVSARVSCSGAYRVGEGGVCYGVLCHVLVIGVLAPPMIVNMAPMCDRYYGAI